jgi:hypothetical protein
MTTLPLRAHEMPVPLPERPVLARIIAAIAFALDVFVEAERLASAAQKRYRFASW